MAGGSSPRAPGPSNSRAATSRPLVVCDMLPPPPPRRRTVLPNEEATTAGTEVVFMVLSLRFVQRFGTRATETSRTLPAAHQHRRAAAGWERSLEAERTDQEKDGAGARDGLGRARRLDVRRIHAAPRGRTRETDQERGVQLGGRRERRQLGGGSLDAAA